MNAPAAASLVALMLVAACGTVPPNVPPSGTIVPEEGRVQVASDVSYTYKELVAAPVTAYMLDGILEKSLDQLRPFTQPILLYFVYQPFAPNWTLEEAKLNEDTYYVRLQAKRFRTGGDGEAMMVMKRRAKQLQHERYKTRCSRGFHRISNRLRRETCANVFCAASSWVCCWVKSEMAFV